MGLKELVAVAALALANCTPAISKQQDKPKESVQDRTEVEILREAAHLHETGCLLSKSHRGEAQQYWAKAEQLLLNLEKKKPDIRIDVLLADVYMNRNKQENGSELGDYEKAIPRWERALKENEKNSNILMEKKGRAQQLLAKCYGDVGLGKFYEAQILTQFAKTEETGKILKEVYKVETKEQSEALSTEKLRSAVMLIEKAMQNTADAGGIGALTFKFDDDSLALHWYRRMVIVAPEKSLGYRRLALHYEMQGKLGHVLDEMDELKEVPEDVKRPKIIDAVIALLDTRRKMGLRPKQTLDPVENLKKALLLYETSTVRWAREMKKERMVDRDHLAAMEEAFIAGALDYNYSQTDERRSAALKRLETAYNSINGGLDNGLGKLDKAYEHFIKIGRTKVEGADKVSEALKARSAGKDY